METYFTPTGFLALLLYVICLAIALVRSRRREKLDPISYALIFIAIIYGASWPAIIHSIENGTYPIQYYHVFYLHYDKFFVHTFTAFLVVAGLLIGWRISEYSYVYKGRGMLSAFKSTSTYEVSFWLMLLLSIVTIALYTFDYGGPINALDYSRLIRSGIFSSFDRSRFSFLLPLCSLSMIACYGFLGLILSMRPRFSWVAGYILTFAVSLYVANLLQGRMTLVVFVGIQLLAIMFNKSRNPRIAILVISVIAPASIYAAYLLADLIQLNSANSFGEFYTREVSFVFVSFFSHLSIQGSSPRWFYDIIMYPAYMLPSSMIGGFINSPEDKITAFVYGYTKGVNNVTSQQPVDIITIGMMQLSYAGVFLYGIIYAAFISVFYKISNSIQIHGLRNIFNTYVSIKFAGMGLFYAGPSGVVVGNFQVIAVIIVVAALISLSRRRTRGLLQGTRTASFR